MLTHVASGVNTQRPRRVPRNGIDVLRFIDSGRRRPLPSVDTGRTEATPSSMDKTLLKGLSVLETLAGMDAGGCTIDALAVRVRLSRSNTHRTLQTLVHAGYVERDAAQGGYRNT